MMKKVSTADAQSFDHAMRIIDRQIRKQELENVGEPEETVNGRLGHVLEVFGTIRPLLLFITAVPGLPPASRKAVSVFIQSLDALSILAVPGDGDDVEDFKAGRDL